MTLMDDNGGTKVDLKVFGDIRKQIKEKLEKEEHFMVGVMIL